jgi:multimeric flavodoxin WrbA
VRFFLFSKKEKLVPDYTLPATTLVMKATILLGTLKKSELSNTAALAEFLVGFLEKENVDCNIIRLVDYSIWPGTCTHMGEGDEWPMILDELLKSQIIIMATPIWWNSPSSEIQRVIERLDELHDEIMQGSPSRLAGKVGGVVISGDSDGAQSVIASVANFYNAIGLTFPPFASLSVLSGQLAKGKKPSREEIMEIYRKDYTATAEKMVRQLLSSLKD